MSFCIPLLPLCSAQSFNVVSNYHISEQLDTAWPDILYCLYLPEVACPLSRDTCLAYLVPPPYLASKYEPENDFLKCPFSGLYNITVKCMSNVLFGKKQSKITTKKLNFGSFNELLYSIVESRNSYNYSACNP